jgi:hypothetical protein
VCFDTLFREFHTELSTVDLRTSGRVKIVVNMHIEVCVKVLICVIFFPDNFINIWKFCDTVFFPKAFSVDGGVLIKISRTRVSPKFKVLN